jgi:hypothetical protein
MTKNISFSARSTYEWVGGERRLIYTEIAWRGVFPDGSGFYSSRPGIFGT